MNEFDLNLHANKLKQIYILTISDTSWFSHSILFQYYIIQYYLDGSRRTDDIEPSTRGKPCFYRNQAIQKTGMHQI